jgi:hypothetical protein
MQEFACRRCGRTMQAGYTTARLWATADPSPSDEPKLVFVVPGEPTAANPIQAFKQGLKGVQANQVYLIRGYRCPACGTVELIAEEKMPLRK